jgi:RNA polymerase sigma factor (sigma-70 family)
MQHKGMLRVESNGVRLRPVEPIAEPADVDWLRDLYNRYSDQVRAVVVRHGGPQVDAEDLVQEVFLAAHRKIQTLREYAVPAAWLHLAALREVWRVRRRARLMRFLPFGVAPTAEEIPLPDIVCAHSEGVTWLYRALEKIPGRQREALILYHVEGLTSVEIGRLLGCPDQTVRSRIFHGRRALLAAVKRQRRREGRQQPR